MVEFVRRCPIDDRIVGVGLKIDQGVATATLAGGSATKTALYSAQCLPSSTDLTKAQAVMVTKNEIDRGVVEIVG
jgi:hypothetical protein